MPRFRSLPLLFVCLLLVPAIFLLLLAVTVTDYNRRLSPVTVALRQQFGPRVDQPQQLRIP